MRAIQKAGLLLCLCGAAAQAYADTDQATEQTGQEAAPSVNVKGIRDPDWKPYSAMLKGVKRFEEKHVLAPGAQLRFILEPRRADVDMHAIALRLESDEAGSVRWIPYIRSAATSDTMRRLGDLRLACEVHWAIDKDTLPFAMRTAMSALGGPCNFVSQKGTYSFSAPQRITAATISFNGKSAPVPFSGASFTPPLREQEWGDESVLELTFGHD